MIIATLVLSLLTSMIWDNQPSVNDTVIGQINLVTLFDNQTLGLEVSFLEERAIYYIESVLDKPPSYYLIGWFPHQGRVMKIDLAHQSLENLGLDDRDPGALVAYPIFESSAGLHRSENHSSFYSINHRYIPNIQVACLDESRPLFFSEYQKLMMRIYQPQYFSTVDFIGFSANKWVENLFVSQTEVSTNGALLANFCEPIFSLCAMVLDAIFYYFPFGCGQLMCFLYQHLSCLAHYVFLNASVTYYALGLIMLPIVYYFALSVCFD